MKIVRVLSVAAAVAFVLSGPAVASASTVVTVGDAQDGKAVTLHPGDSLVVTLASTAWTIDAPKGTVLTAKGEQVIKVNRPGPGATGTTSRTFSATAVGNVVVVASRINCGEALRCSAEQAGFALSVHVVAVAVPQLPHTGTPAAATAVTGTALLLVGGAALALGRTRRRPA